MIDQSTQNRSKDKQAVKYNYVSCTNPENEYLSDELYFATLPVKQPPVVPDGSDPKTA